MNILLKAYTKVNLGDDLFLKMIIERYPNTSFILRAPNNYKKIFKNSSNVVILDNFFVKKNKLSYRIYNYILRNFFSKIYKRHIVDNIIKTEEELFKKTDAFVSIGGSIFMQSQLLPTYYDIEYYKIVEKYFDKTFYLGCNFGPFLTLDFLNSYKRIFANATDVCFREKKSWELFAELENVRYSTDIVFGLKVQNKPKEINSVGFSIVGSGKLCDSIDYEDSYVKIIEFYQKEGYEIYLFSFCKAEGDEVTINKIFEKLNTKERVNLVFYNGDMEVFLDLYSKVEKVFCGRFHSMILSMLLNQKIYPITYSDKMINILSDIKYQGEFIEVQKLNKIEIEKVYDQIDKNKYDIDQIKDKAKDQFKILDLFINGSKINNI